jgi:glycosyltransferase involved in cell wall biosynthesis
MGKVLLSMVIPTLNGSDTIKYTLSSIFANDFEREFEVIVVDNGSTDNTVDVVKISL